MKMKNTKKDSSLMILESILNEGAMSRIDLAERNQLAPSTVTASVSELLDKKIIREAEVAQSTGGRKPVLLEICGNYGYVLVVEITRKGVNAKRFSASLQMVDEVQLSSTMLTGDSLLSCITHYIYNLFQKKTDNDGRLLGIGLLCQDDIPEYDLMTTFSTSISTDMLRLEIALASSWNVPVKKELIHRYSLHNYLNDVEADWQNYGYIDIGKRITASFVLNKKLVQSSNGAVFDLSSAVLCGNYAGDEGQETRTLVQETAQENTLGKIQTKEFADKLVSTIRSAMLFFPVDHLFIGGTQGDIESIVNEVTDEIGKYPTIQKAPVLHGDTYSILAKQLLKNNPRTFFGWKIADLVINE
jgi:hypothetical protein